ncbi:MAG: PKD domain-containing protein, partial [Oceanococcaceae bacterium]
MTVATRKAILAASFSFLLAACGGGGGSGAGTDPNNLPPVVDAGPNRQLESNQTVTLTGTATDPDGSVEQVQWTQISGTPVVQLTNANTLSASFAAPAVNNSTTLVFQLSATDTDNATSTDTVSITLIPPGSSVAPVIEEPIAPKRANQGETVTLTATATDPDGSIARYDWAFLDATPSITPAVNIVISGDNDATPEATFVAPAVQQPTVLRFLLTVTDDSSTQNTDTAEAFVTVYPLPQPARAAQLYVTDGAGLISRFESQANTPTEFTTDIPEFGRFDPGAGTRTINGPIALTVDGRLVQTDEEDPNGIQEVCAFPRRGNDDQFGTVRDRRINFDLFGSDGTGAADGRIENYAGVAIAHAKGYLITIDTYSGSGSQDARAIHVYGSAVTGNRPYDDAEGNRQLVADIPLGANGNDLLYDEQGDRLFVTLKSGRIAAFENFLTEIEAVRAERGDAVAIGEEIEVDALIEINGVVTSPAEPHDFRGIAYHRESDRLIVSDIGLPGASGSDDGAIYILSNATDAVRRGFGATVDADAVIVGRAGDAPLGDPTDISLNGRDLVVADQANNRIYVYADIFGAISQYDGVTPLAPAPADDPLVVAGATHIVVQPLDTPFRPHVNDLGPDMDGLELASVLAYRTVTVEGAVQQQLLRLAPNLGGSAAIPNLSYALPADYTAVGMGLAVNGDV